MAGFAERYQIILSMGTALINREDMMDFGNRNIAIMLEALLTERMLGNIYIPECAPAAAIDLIVIGMAGLIILPTGNSFMFVAIASMGYLRATGVSTGMRQLIWHGKASLYI